LTGNMLSILIINILIICLGYVMHEPRAEPKAKSRQVLPSHRVPAHLARRFHQICLGVTAEILVHEDLTPMLYGVMAAIQEEPGSGQRRLASRLGVDAVTLGQMIEFLERKGLVKREVDPNDRRARQLYLTRRGTDLRHRLRPSLLAAQGRILEPLAKAERTALLDMLARVIEANDSYARPGNGRRKPLRKTNLPIDGIRKRQ
jgi:MarR family transcriptional regulator, temperature-dependent positive regulator of motility